MRVVVLVALLAACSGDDDDGRNAGANTRGANGFMAATGPEVPVAERRANDPFHQNRPTPRLGQNPANNPNSPTRMNAAEADMSSGRNFEAELQAAAGSPMSCGEMGGLTGNIVIPLSATVSEQGRVTRANVGGSLPVATRDCMRRRIESHRFAPVPNGPRSITASLTVQGTPGETMMTEAPMTGFALQQGQQAIGGPTGTSISSTMSTPISNYGDMQAGAFTIMGPSGTGISQMNNGTAIMGPTGTGIAN